MAMVDDITVNLEEDEATCFEKYHNSNLSGVILCPIVWDSLLCWPPTLPGKTIFMPCPFGSFHANSKDIFASRTCEENTGEWLGNRTDFSQCLQYIEENGNQSWAPLAVAMVLLIGSFISIIVLSASIFIFLYFRCLRCSSSIRVHVQLFASLILQGALMTAAATPTLLPHSVQTEWLCRCLVVLQMYSGISCTNWMFIEGLHLHSRLTSRVFQKEVPLTAYNALGWGFPLFCTAIWFGMMSRIPKPNRCWSGYGRNPLIWIITGPMIVALVVNSLFLVDIIRILISRRIASNRTTTEMDQLRKAVKATALLFPLLGIPHLLFCINPGGDGALEEAYMLANATLKSSQGFFVSILYCFMNTEVQLALRKAYMRCMSRRRCGRSSTTRQTSATYVTSQSESKKAVTTVL